MRSFLLLSLFSLSTAACSSSTTEGEPSDAGGDGTTPDGGGYCCPPSPAPACCMDYGGWTESATAPACGKACDGMPNPGDPAWRKVKDSHGCDMWSSAGSTGARCGEIPDSGRDTASETSTDADAAGDATDATDASGDVTSDARDGD